MKKISTILAILFFITTVVFSALYFSKSDETVPSNSDEQLQENKNDVKVTDSEPEQDSEPDQQKGESETIVPNHQSDQKENESDVTFSHRSDNPRVIVDENGFAKIIDSVKYGHWCRIPKFTKK